MQTPVSLQTIPWQTIYTTTKLNQTLNSLQSGSRPVSDKNSDRLKETCAELESLFIYYLLKEMRATVPKTGFISGGKAEEIYTSMLDSQLAKELSGKGGIGLSSLLLPQLGADLKHNGNRNEEE